MPTAHHQHLVRGLDVPLAIGRSSEARHLSAVAQRVEDDNRRLPSLQVRLTASPAWAGAPT